MMSPNCYRVLLLAFGVAVAGAILWGCGRASKPGAGSGSGEGEMLAVGTRAPAFSLQDQNGKVFKLEDLRGKKNVVLVFYPGDNTPVCTSQLCAIRDDFADFEKLGVAVFGINPQSAESHRSFVEKQHFPFPLLVDSDKKILAAYGTKGLMTKRTVYGIDKDGGIVFAQRGVPKTDEILAAFQSKPGK